MVACGFRAATPAELLVVAAPCILARDGTTVADDLAALSGTSAKASGRGRHARLRRRRVMLALDQ